MKANEKKVFYPQSRRVRPWVYILILAVNVLLFASIGYMYSLYEQNTKQRLFNENINNANNLNTAAANAAFTYTIDMGVKIDDIINYITLNNLSHDEVIHYLDESNTNPDRQFQLILCGNFGPNGEIRYGDYSGISVRKEKITQDDGTEALKTIQNNIDYSTGYYNILRSFTDVQDHNDNGLCFTPEFTNPDTKLKGFAVYRHIVLTDGTNKKLYAIMLVVNSETALSLFNHQHKYEGQSSTMIKSDGTYIIKNSNYRNANFYDYIVNYNALTLDKKEQLKTEIFEATRFGNMVADLYYKNHKGDDCVFSVIRMENGWYSITCVPLLSLNLEDGSTNFSLIMLVFFASLFVFDGAVVLFVGKVLNYNIAVAENATKTANQASLAKSRFLSTMSHELRTPLNAIIGFASLSNDSLDNPQQLKDYLKKIEISSKLLLQLISDILDISAIETSKLKINASAFNIAKMITALSSIYYDQSSKKDIEFNVILKNVHSENFIGDSVRVNQILLNFLSNAIKFTPSGGKITLLVDAQKCDDESASVRFTVTDTGCGISDELKSRLFKPFERASGTSAFKYSGTGLGLSIAKNITELMGGTIGLESEEGSGSTFWAEIPFKIAPQSTHRHFSPIKGLHVVAAVHNSDEREYIAQILTNIGVEHSCASDVESTISLLKAEKETAHPFNLCILDWKMADLNALDAVKKIREMFSKNELKLIVLSYDLAAAKSQCLEFGADLIFYKPVFSSSLYNALEELTTESIQNVPENTNQENSKSYDLHKKRILLVEDNEINTVYAKLVLQKFNLEVLVAENGKKAYQLFCNSATDFYDLILMDIQMPEMNGYEATEAIRKTNRPDAKRIPIIAMTADAFSEDVEKAHKAGMNEHVSKPIEPDLLYSILKKYLV